MKQPYTCKIRIMLAVIQGIINNLGDLEKKDIDVQEIIEMLQYPIQHYCQGKQNSKNCPDEKCPKLIKIYTEEEGHLKEQLQEKMYTYLTVIIGNADLLMEHRYNDKEEGQKYLAKIRTSAWEIKEIIKKELN